MKSAVSQSRFNKIGKENLMVIKTKFQPIGKEYPFTYKQKKLFFDEIQ